MRDRFLEIARHAESDKAIHYEIVKSKGGQTRVIFTCHCGETHSKQVGDVVGKKQTGLLCKLHSIERVRRKKILDTCMSSAKLDGAIFHKDESVWSRPGRIVFTCFCGIKHSKDPSAIRQGQGMFCREHTFQKSLEKIKETSLAKYGVTHYSSSKVVRDQYKQNNLKKYGVEHIAHVPAIHEKQQKYRWKNYTMPSGEVRLIQGYEHFAMDELVKIYKEDDIITKRSSIKYLYNGENHYYYPDFVIKTPELKIIEVKSKHTMYYKTFYEKNIAKRKACIEQGYKFEFWIYDSKGTKTLVA